MFRIRKILDVEEFFYLLHTFFCQVDILLFGNFSHCTRVVSTVSGVYNDNKVFRFSAATAKGGDKQPC